MDVSTEWQDPNDGKTYTEEELVKVWDGPELGATVSAAPVWAQPQGLYGPPEGPLIPHPSGNRFIALLEELGELHALKNQDYGRPVDPYANVRGSQEWGVKPWVGAMVRANDKLKRLQKFAQDGKLANEGVEDSFKDLAVYSIIALVLYREGTESDARH